MINLLPITRIIIIIAVFYASLISVILFFHTNESSDIIDIIFFAIKGVTILNFILLCSIHFWWRWLWKKVPFLSRTLFPDLNGEWDITIHWQWNKNVGVAKGTAYIKQDLLNISMEVSSQDSDSITLLAKPKKDSVSGRPLLYYIYRNTPKLKNGNKKLPYDGTAELKLGHNNFDLLEGNYYTDRLTTGHYELRRKIAKQ